ncbi:MAG TPA: VOC family protein [Stellaceae bacterium]|jgi:PhnB protein|nr:VOC family protein [Stellaceae bacterium]
MPIQPYLAFNGRCEEAIDFYRKALGAEVNMMMRFKQCPDQSMISPENAEKIMHADLKIGDGVLLMSDGMCAGTTKFEGMSLSFTVADEAEAGRRFNALADGGEVRMPLAKTFFSPSFGMVQDKFGVGWMIYVAPQEAHRPS